MITHWSHVGRVRTRVVFAIEVAGVAPVHPPPRPVLEGTVALELVVVLFGRTELHAIVRSVELVAGVIAKVKTVKCIASITSVVVGIGKAVHVNLWPNFEHSIVGIPEAKMKTMKLKNGH